MATRFRFGLAPVFIFTVLACVMAASAYYLVNADWRLEGDQVESNRPLPLFFVVFTLAVPCVLVVVLSLIVRISRWRKPRNQQKDDDPK